MKIPQLIAFFIHFESTTIYFAKQGKFPVLHISGNSTENVLAMKTICWRFREKKKPEKNPVLTTNIVSDLHVNTWIWRLLATKQILINPVRIFFRGIYNA